jgi:hypothetical protein
LAGQVRFIVEGAEHLPRSLKNAETVGLADLRFHVTGILANCTERDEVCMAKVTLVFALLLVALGLAGYWAPAAASHRADSRLVRPGAGHLRLLAISPNEGRRKLFMHINVTIGLLGFLGGAVEPFAATFMPIRRASSRTDRAGLEAHAGRLLLIYVILCVRSFIAARRSGKV